MPDVKNAAVDAEPVARRGDPVRAAAALAEREIVRFLRQRSRVIGALGQPLLFWLLFGAGMHGAFRIGSGEEGPSFWEYYFPGTLVLILLFTAIFATISIIEDRREGFLQGVLVSPTPRWSMVLGKVLGGSVLALGQAVLFLLIGISLGLRPDLLQITGLIGLLFVVAVGLTSLGFVLAWQMRSSQGFHAIMNLLLMPMWLLSGAFFPIPAPQAGSPLSQSVMHWLMRINPVSYGVAGVRRLLHPDFGFETVWTPSLVNCVLVTLTFTAVAFLAACAIAQRPVAEN